MRNEALEDGGRRSNYRPDENSQNESVIPIGRDTLAVVAQMFWVGPAKDTATIINTRYLLDAATGRVLRHDEGPERLLAVWREFEAVMTEDPEPTVKIRRR